jgi:tRNA A37 threonylcarbamoyladenosine modification protein TsaB
MVNTSHKKCFVNILSEMNNSVNIVLHKEIEFLFTLDISSFLSEFVKKAVKANIDLSQTDKIIVISGPGAFSSIRVGDAFARAISLMSNANIYYVSWFDITLTYIETLLAMPVKKIEKDNHNIEDSEKNANETLIINNMLRTSHIHIVVPGKLNLFTNTLKRSCFNDVTPLELSKNSMNIMQIDQIVEWQQSLDSDDLVIIHEFHVNIIDSLYIKLLSSSQATNHELKGHVRLNEERFLPFTESLKCKVLVAKVDVSKVLVNVLKIHEQYSTSLKQQYSAIMYCS